MKKLMILGAGIYQVPLIQTAKQMGLYTIVVSIPGDYPGFSLADKIYKLDTRDRKRILHAAKEEQIDGICTSGTDVAVSTIGYVCEKMGLHGISLTAAEVVTNKARMKETFLSGKVSVADGKRIKSVIEAKKAAEELRYPVVIKRVDSSGSRGITVVRDASQTEKAYKYAVQDSLEEYVLIEKFLEGTEIGVDGFVQNGKLVFLAPHEKFVYAGEKITVPIGHKFPYCCSETLQAEITLQMQAAVNSAGINDCPVNADVMVDGEKVSIIELGGRSGATCIPELISCCYEFDFYEQMIRSALGEKVRFLQNAKVPCMAKLLFSPADGRITRIDQDAIMTLRKTGVDIKLDCAEGQEISAMVNGTDRIGHIIMKTEKEEELNQIIDCVYQFIQIDGISMKELWNRCNILY